MNNMLAIMKNKVRLEQMIEVGESADKILKQSQKLDRYIAIDIKERVLYKNKVRI